jgi:hypothetical protein
MPYQEPVFLGIRPRINEDDPDVVGIAYLLTRDEYERLLLSEGDGKHGEYMEIVVFLTPLADPPTEESIIECKLLDTRKPKENPHPKSISSDNYQLANLRKKYSNIQPNSGLFPTH